jgi:tetratricopeptide (TPR) repeat protein
MNLPFSWIECNAWELDFFALPHRIPWPADVPVNQDGQPQFDPANLLRGIELLEENDPAAAAPWIAFAEAAASIQELNEALEDSEYVQAAELLGKIDAAHPGSPFALFHRAFLERQNGRDAEALALYQQAAQKAPRLGFIWSHLGGMLAEAGRRDEAIAAFKNALQANNTDQVALEGLVQLKAAVKVFKDPKDPKSVVYLPMEQYQGIAAQQIEALASDPEQLAGFGEFQLREGHTPEIGVKALEKALEIRPNHARTMVSLGAGYRMLGQFDRAIETLHRVTELEPENAWGFFHLAQAHNAAKDKAGEAAALDRVLALDPNFQPAIGIRFGIDPAHPKPEVEQQILDFAAERNSWMAFLVASSLARERGDLAAAQERAERAYEIKPDAEEVLLHYSSILGDTKDAAKLDDAIAPAVRLGKYSKRLDWNYAQALRQLDRTNEAIALLRDAAAVDGVPADFKQAAAVAVDFWNGFLGESAVPLETHRTGALRRPVLLTIEDGDGGVIIAGGKPLPAEQRFPFRTAGADSTEARVALQQGQSGGTPAPRALGAFTVSGIRPAATGPTTIECFAGATNDGTLRFGAMQDGKKLPVIWSAPV